MGWMLKDFTCNSCLSTFEELYKVEEEDIVACKLCGSHDVAIVQLSAPSLGKYSMADQETRASILRKRSADHTKKEVLGNIEKFGDAGLQRRREYLGK